VSGITLASINPALESQLAERYGRTVSIRRVWSDQWRDPEEATMDVCAADPELLVIGSDMAPDKVRLLVPEVDRRFPATTIVVLLSAPDPEAALELLRLGARDVLDESSIGDLGRPELDRVLEVARARRQTTASAAPTLRRRMIAVLSPKGGTGKTTIATNLALGLARRRPKQVALLDLDLQFGDCAAALGLKPEHSILDAMKALSHDRSALKVFLTAHPDGLALLPPPDDLAAVDSIDADHLKQLVSAMVEEFPFVVTDTAGGIDPACVAALELATDFLLVSTTDVPAIRALRRQLDALDRIGMTSQRRTFVLNRANAKVGLSVADVEAAVGLEARFEIPSTRLIPVSTNEGQPAIARDGGNVASRFDDLADYFAPRTEDSSRSLFRALRKDR
jgi:pilus assembly protein CpaE